MDGGWAGERSGSGSLPAAPAPMIATDLTVPSLIDMASKALFTCYYTWQSEGLGECIIVALGPLL